MPFTFLECSTSLNEVNSIAKYIKWIHETTSVSLADIVVTMRNPEEYSPLFREIFPLHGLPVNITDRPQLKISPVITAICTVLDIIAFSYRAEDIKRALSSPYLRLSNSYSSTDILNYLELFIDNSRMKGGKGINDWIYALDHSILSLKNRIALLHIDDEMQKSTLERHIKAYDILHVFFTELHGILSKAKNRLTVHDFIQCIHFFLNSFSVHELLESSILTSSTRSPSDIHQSPTELLERDIRALKTFTDVLEEYRLLHTYRNPHQELPFNEIYDSVLAAISGAQYQIREKPGTGITVTSMEQIRELDYSVIIICGLNEGIAPLKYTADTFMGRELSNSEERHIRRERTQFYLSLVHHAPSSKERQYLLTYPTINADKNELVRSHFIDELLKVLHIDEEETIIKSYDNHSKSVDFLNVQSSLYEQWLHLLQNTSDVGNNQIQNKKMVINAIDYWKTNNQVERKHNPLQSKENLIFRDASPYSITELDEFAKCGYYYFSKRLLHLKDKQDSTTWLSHLENGLFFHEVLYRFYTSDLFTSSADFIKPHRLLRSRHQEYRKVLFAIAEELFATIRYDHPYVSIEEDIIFGNDKGLKGKLDYWLEMEIGLHKESNFHPALFEVSFGNKSDTIPAIKLSDNLRVKGKIDRIELNDDATSFVIGDYKTGKTVPSNNDIVKGKHQQMPIYALAAKEILGNYHKLHDIQPAHALYYSLLTFTSKKVIDQGKDNAVSLEDLLQNTVTHVNEIMQGNFPLKEKRDNDCNSCSFSSVCRIHVIPPVRGETEVVSEEE